MSTRLPLFLAVLACGDVDSTPSRIRVTDSAGVQIVTNPSAGVPVWELDSAPLTQIGLVDGPPEHVFSNPTNALLLPGGGVIVADAGAGELKIFDASGQHVSTRGRRGRGPGEFETLRLLRDAEGKRFYAFDLQLRRLSLLDTIGGAEAELTLESAYVGQCPTPVVILDDSLIVSSRCGGSPPETGVGGVYRNPLPLYVYDKKGTPLHRFLEIPGSEWAFRHRPRVGNGCGGPVPWSGPCIDFGGALFGRGAPVAGDSRQLYVSDAEEFEILVYAFDGRLRRIIRTDLQPQRVTDEDLEAHRREWEARSANRTREGDWRPVPTVFPALESFLIDAAGLLWVRHYSRPIESRQTYSIFRPSGELVAQLHMPTALRVHDVGLSRVVASWRDELDVPFFGIFELRRTPGATSTTGGG